ncbi:DUF6503 family protein [Robiginitalea sp. IMCC44478]|uniref:DUF6503 family protein n=1 Tax=Robiginitalea sp. IMCC44478 TaxID=3459122 RepID=UPI0040419E21
MQRFILISLIGLVIGCRQSPKQEEAPLTAQQVVDSAITFAGGDLYSRSKIEFDFRDFHYSSYREDGKRVLTRTIPTDSGTIRDVRKGQSFTRYLNEQELSLPDSTAQRYSNAVNSVHYFAYLPYGLNDRAVNKRMLDTVSLGDHNYYKIQITFDQEGGGKDFEDVFIYWFNTDTFRPDFLAYEFQVNGGGMRFREAQNQRVVGGITFSDFINYKPTAEVPLAALDSLYAIPGGMEKLSEINLRNIRVSPDSYN